MRHLAFILFASLLVLLSAAVVRVMIRVGMLDHPGARSSHTSPTPKGGGVGIVVAFLVGMGASVAVSGRADAPVLGLLAASAGLAAVSYLDDLRSWPFVVKLAAQLMAALIVVACGLRLRTIDLPWIGAWNAGPLGLPITIGWVLFATNAVNFIDGLNGLASGSVAIACLFLAAIGWMQHDLFIAASSSALACGLAGFLPFNFPSARIFMGDVGSQFCGFVVAELGVLASGLGGLTLSVLLVPMLLMGIWFDVAFTLARRTMAGDRITAAHRSHLYQVAQRSGMSAAVVTLIHWSMAVWGAACCLISGAATGSYPALGLVAVLIPQLAWLAFVRDRAKRTGITDW